LEWKAVKRKLGDQKKSSLRTPLSSNKGERNKNTKKRENERLQERSEGTARRDFLTKIRRQHKQASVTTMNMLTKKEAVICFSSVFNLRMTGNFGIII
jgi:hypothetical protein